VRSKPRGKSSVERGEVAMRESLRLAVKMALLQKKLSQREVAGKMNITQQAISEWLKVGRVPEKHWDDVKKILGIDPSKFKGNGFAPAKNGSAPTSDAVESTVVFTPKVQEEDGKGSAGGLVSMQVSTEEHEAILLFRQYGNRALFDRCMRQLKYAEEIFR
jgi:hypothetical protein